MSLICFLSFESISVPLSTSSAQEVTFHVLYIPQSVPKTQFLDDFTLFLDGAALSGSEHILLGDFKFSSILANAMVSSRLGYFNSYCMGPAKAVLLNFRKSKVHFVILFSNRTK